MADPRNFLLNTDYPSPMVVYTKTGSFTAEVATTVASYEIAHSDTPSYYLVPKMVFSTDENFTKTFNRVSDDLDIQMFSSTRFNPLGGSYGTNIYYYNFSGSAQTIYYRIYYFPRPGIITHLEPYSSECDNFVLNTDYNIPKIKIIGNFNTAVSPSVAHNLGYIPFAEAWVYNIIDGTHVEAIEAQSAIYNGSSWTDGLEVTATELIYHGSDTIVYYQIYVED